MSDTTYTSTGEESDSYQSDPYRTSEGDTVYTVTGNDWDTVLAPPDGEKDRLIVNMGPQHPSTHGVLRLIVELDGEAVEKRACSYWLPAHRHREEHGVPNVDARLHVRDSWITSLVYITSSCTRSPLRSCWALRIRSPTVRMSFA